MEIAPQWGQELDTFFFQLSKLLGVDALLGGLECETKNNLGGPANEMTDRDVKTQNASGEMVSDHLRPVQILSGDDFCATLLLVANDRYA